MSANNPPNPPTAATADVFGPGVIDFLNEVNGQDTYDAKAEAMGNLSRAHYLVLPLGFMPNDTTPEAVGTAGARPGWNADLYAQIYVLNKGVFGTNEEQVKGALLRAELVKAGWYTSQYEVRYEAIPVGYRAAFTADIALIREFRPVAANLALLLPLASEYVFRTMGHHFLTGLRAEFIRKYTLFFASCTMPNLVKYLPAEILFHRVAHWTPLKLALDVAKNPANKDRIPNAVVVRATAAPAGTALVATSCAILETLDGTGLGSELVKASGLDLSKVRKTTDAIKTNPAKYHIIPAAYKTSELNNNEVLALDEAKAIAHAIAPVLQGFLDSLPRSSDLTGAKALEKHASLNPAMRGRAKRYFKEVTSTKATSMAALFRMDERSPGATEGEDTVDIDEEVAT